MDEEKARNERVFVVVVCCLLSVFFPPFSFLLRFPLEAIVVTTMTSERRASIEVREEMKCKGVSVAIRNTYEG